MRFIFTLAIAFSICIFADEGIKIDDSPLQDGKYGYSWHATSDFQNPESTYFDSDLNIIFVSNVSGSPTDKDGKGFIQKLDTDGKMLDSAWITGLNAPKGMRSHDGILWVSDIDRIIAIDISKSEIIKTLEVKNAAFLNDVAIDENGIIYVSDMLTNKIHKVQNNNVSVIFGGSQAEYPNGLLVSGDNLIVASWGDRGKRGNLYSLNLKTNEKTLITTKPLGNLDGLELDNDGNYLVSDWTAGKVFRISPKGDVKLLLYGFKGSADIGFIASKNLLLLPRMRENKVTAYDLSKYPKD